MHKEEFFDPAAMEKYLTKGLTDQQLADLRDYLRTIYKNIAEFDEEDI